MKREGARVRLAADRAKGPRSLLQIRLDRERTKCLTCQDEKACEAIREAMDQVNAAPSLHVNVSEEDIWTFVKERVPTYAVKHDAMGNHIRAHEPERWAKLCASRAT